MLELTIPTTKMFNEQTGEITVLGGGTIKLEHSLAAISKWEAIVKKPFLEQESMTAQQLLLYIKCMSEDTIDDKILAGITDKNIEDISDYISDSMTATWFKEDHKKTGGKRIVTSELIYYWMATVGIPFECDKWHFNRLMTLIRIAGEEQKPSEKMDKKALAKRNRSLNAARRAKMHSRG